VTGKKCQGPSTPARSAVRFMRFRFFAIRSFRVSSTWFGKWFTRWWSRRRAPPPLVAELAYGTFSWIQPTSA